MRKSRICLVSILTSLLIVGFSISSFAEDKINILNYSLKPVGYVNENKFIQAIWKIELLNTDGTPHSFNVKVVFYDKEKNQIKEIKKACELNASETKTFSDAVLLDPAMAKQIGSTKGFIEDLK